jgi:general secretion pathway protein G
MSIARRNAFTLIEVLIVVIVMVVLAATIVPQFWLPTSDVKDGSLRFNLHAIRSQIELYKLHHGGKVPTLARFAADMTRPAPASGKTGGANPVCGPYIQGQIPVNPFTGSNAVVSVVVPGKAPTAPVPGGAGWQYDQTTGGFFPNNADYYARPFGEQGRGK